MGILILQSPTKDIGHIRCRTPYSSHGKSGQDDSHGQLIVIDLAFYLLIGSGPSTLQLPGQCSQYLLAHAAFQGLFRG